MRIFTLLLLFTLGLGNNSEAQNLVDINNHWLLDDCCVILGELQCTTYDFSFAEEFEFDGLTYRKLNIDGSNIIWEIGEYYREFNGKIYLKKDASTEEYLIYDFNVEVGDILEIGPTHSILKLEVRTIDSIELTSGEMRKSIEVGPIGEPYVSTQWIEGIGSLLSPFNTSYMFTLDCWMGLNCFKISGDLIHELGDCQITNIKTPISRKETIDISPNPVDNILTLDLEISQIQSILIFNEVGKVCQTLTDKEFSRIDVSNLASGLYFIVVYKENFETLFSKFVKH